MNDHEKQYVNQLEQKIQQLTARGESSHEEHTLVRNFTVSKEDLQRVIDRMNDMLQNLINSPQGIERAIEYAKQTKKVYIKALKSHPSDTCNGKRKRVFSFHKSKDYYHQYIGSIIACRNFILLHGKEEENMVTELHEGGFYQLNNQLIVGPLQYEGYNIYRSYNIFSTDEDNNLQDVNWDLSDGHTYGFNRYSGKCVNANCTTDWDIAKQVKFVASVIGTFTQ